MKYSIEVAGSKHKSRAILGALRSGFINVLITDNVKTSEILKKDIIKDTSKLINEKVLIDLSV